MTNFNELNDKEYNLVRGFIQKQFEDPVLCSNMWVEGYRSLFDPKTYAPMQCVRFYILSGREIIERIYVCDTRSISFNEFRSRMMMDERGCIDTFFIGPWVPKDSPLEDLASIIRIYEDIQHSKHTGRPRVPELVDPRVSNLI